MSILTGNFRRTATILKLQGLHNKMAHSDPRIARLFQNSVRTWFHHKLCRQQWYFTEYRDNENDRDTGQGKAQRWKYKRLRMVGGQAGDCLSD